MDLNLISAGTAFIPVLSDGLRGVFARFTGGAGAEPQNAQERISMMAADTERLQALAALDNVGETYKWVNAVRGLVRPLTALGLIATYAGVVAISGAADQTLADFAMMAGFYYFGERTKTSFRGR